MRLRRIRMGFPCITRRASLASSSGALDESREGDGIHALRVGETRQRRDIEPALHTVTRTMASVILKVADAFLFCRR